MCVCVCVKRQRDDSRERTEAPQSPVLTPPSLLVLTPRYARRTLTGPRAVPPEAGRAGPHAGNLEKAAGQGL